MFGLKTWKASSQLEQEDETRVTTATGCHTPYWTPKRELGWWDFSNDKKIHFDRVWLYNESRKHRTLKGTLTIKSLIR